MLRLWTTFAKALLWWGCYVHPLIWLFDGVFEILLVIYWINAWERFEKEFIYEDTVFLSLNIQLYGWVRTKRIPIQSSLFGSLFLRWMCALSWWSVWALHIVNCAYTTDSVFVAAEIPWQTQVFLQVNTQAHESVKDCSDRKNSKYYVIVIQVKLRLT